MKTKKPHYVTKYADHELAEKINQPLVSIDGSRIKGFKVEREDKSPYYVVVVDGVLYEDYIYDIKYLSEDTVKKLKLSRYVKLITPQPVE